MQSATRGCDLACGMIVAHLRHGSPEHETHRLHSHRHQHHHQSGEMTPLAINNFNSIGLLSQGLSVCRDERGEFVSVDHD